MTGYKILDGEPEWDNEAGITPEGRSLAYFEDTKERLRGEGRERARQETIRVFGPMPGTSRQQYVPRQAKSRAQAKAETQAELALSGGVLDGHEAQRETERAYAPGRAGGLGASMADDLVDLMSELRDENGERRRTTEFRADRS